MKILALTKYGPMAASTRQRVLQYAPALGAAGMTLTTAPLLDDDYVRGLVDGARAGAFDIARSYGRRLGWLARSRSYDMLWVYAELFPYLPGPLERLAALTGRPVVVDWDDAFFHAYDTNDRAIVRRLLGRKMVPLLDSAAAATCGNAYLHDYASKHCRRTIILPTVVDTERYRPLATQSSIATPPLIGWIGSPSTWRYVRPHLPLLARLVGAGKARFRAIGAGSAAEADRFDGIELVAWSEAREIAEVQAMDIGIMPLEDRAFERGKCGYKLIQYMACGLPVVASPIGVNTAIVAPEVNGLLAASDAEWAAALERLIASSELRAAWGAAGRARVEVDYSLAAHAPRLVSLFRSLETKDA